LEGHLTLFFCNVGVNRQGRPRWFSGPGDVSAIPVGEQTYANVDYELSDFSTSPVPTVLMLKGHSSEVQESEIRNIAVNKKADALFFLHTFNRSRSIGGWERKYQDALRRCRTPPEAPTLFQYVVHYTDGESIAVPVRWQDAIGHWVSAAPKAFPQAAIAWTHAFEDNAAGEKAVVYSMQWNNPRPDATIKSLDITYGPDGNRWGAPAVFAITAATAMQ